MTATEFNGLFNGEDEAPYFFLHVPKTAGTTFTSILDQLFQEQDICPAYYTFELSDFSKEELAKYRLFRGHIYYNVLAQRVGKTFKTFTFVRNPVDHAVSLLEEFKRSEKYLYQKDLAYFIRQTEDVSLPWKDRNYEAMTLHKFVETEFNYQNQQVRRLTDNSLYDSFDPKKDPPASVILTSADQNDLETAKNLLVNCFFVGLTERFEDSLILFCYLLGIKPIRTIPRLNSSTNRPSRDEISADILQQIRTKSALDVKLYEFASQLFEERFAMMTKELVDCYASANLAATDSSSPSRESLYELLDKHYQANFKKFNPPLTSLTFTLDQPLYGEGWYIRENNPYYGYIRWTGPGLIASLDLPLAAQTDLKISIEILNALKKELVESLVVEVNATEIPLTFSYNEFKTLTYTGIIKAEILQKNPGLATLVFKVSEVIDLAIINPGKGDDRKLGIALKRIDIIPA